MTKKWILGAILGAALVISGVARAHEGHTHKFMGTVSAVTAIEMQLKTPEGKIVTAKLNPKTTFARGKQKVEASAVKVGERVVVTVPSEKEMIASTVTMAAPTPVVAKK